MAQVVDSLPGKVQSLNFKHHQKRKEKRREEKREEN
jgi:hypothetical protein